ncbi:MAG: dehydrogenase [Rhodospirillales bacterium CG15_BIG_FIL_POST_REV_8_21_14_020_66_15]|nr:MAG: dehydrogenase [Rhodospirillales bacterium CG15_BIG_FIL_POST_REV_8_21_14_020_66_15]
MTLGVAVIGLGVGEQHARAFAAAPGCRVTWLYDLDAAKAERVARDLGQGRVAESFDQILADPAVDIVSIATFDHLHFDEVCRALDAGKHVFVEKPLCRTESEASEIAAHWAKAGNLHLRSNLVLRAAPVYVWLRKAIQAGDLGQVYAFDGDYLYGRIHKITAGWRKDVPDYSVMEGGGIHIIDLMLRLMDETPETVATVGAKIATRGTDFRYDDFMATTFAFPSGAIGRITANFGCVHPHHHVIRVFGTQATFIYDDQGPRLFRDRRDGAKAEKLDLAPLPAGKGVLIPDFIQAIRTGVDPSPAAEGEFALIRVLAAADTALAVGSPQPIRTQP